MCGPCAGAAKDRVGVAVIRYLLAVLSAALLASAPLPVQAARISPMVVDVEPFGRESIARVELTNPGAGEFPVEVQMFRGVISEDGQLELFPADDDFLVFPAQIVVPANSQQAFRVQYVGDPELAKSEVYYMQVRQVPVEVSPGQSQVQVVVNFNVLVNVIPDGSAPEPVVDKVAAVMNGEQPGIQVRLANRGTRYFTAGTLPWQIRGQAEDGSAVSMQLTPEQMAKLIGVGVVAPERFRSFFIPTERPMAEEGLTVTLGG